jgi:arsenate reductase-like glutaredoxin family protein
VETAAQVDARKATLKEKEALALAAQADEIYASKGKQVVHLDLKKDKPDKATLAALLLGPTGNLRAPTLRKGRTLIVGFDEATYARLLK